MGTNYYLHSDLCPHCGHSNEKRHIGKSSTGWCFALHVYPEDGIHDLPDWEREWSQPGLIIKDEYGQFISVDEMKEIITKRAHTPWEKKTLDPKVYGFYNSEKEFHQYNNSERGPNGLARSRVDVQHCIGHGAGTWDLITGYFS